MKKRNTMTMWTNEETKYDREYRRIADRISKTRWISRKPLPVWVIRVGDDLYIRCMNGISGAWYRGVQECHQGHIHGSSVDCEVTFIEEPSSDINDLIDSKNI